MNNYVMNYEMFESDDPMRSSPVYVVQLDGEVVAICHNEQRCWSISNSYGTDSDGNPIAEVVIYPDLESAIDAYGGRGYINRSDLASLRRGSDWIA
jgi:hypothetical protein